VALDFGAADGHQDGYGYQGYPESCTNNHSALTMLKRSSTEKPECAYCRSAGLDCGMALVASTALADAFDFPIDDLLPPELPRLRVR
jgi:hypothetical protein